MHKMKPTGQMEVYPAGTECQNDIVLTSMRRDNVASTSLWRHFHVIVLPGSNVLIKRFGCQWVFCLLNIMREKNQIWP